MIQLQGELAHRFPHGHQVIVSDSDHMIPYNAPQTIVEATRSILAEIGGSSNRLGIERGGAVGQPSE
jgi:hypothetical protein